MNYRASSFTSVVPQMISSSVAGAPDDLVAAAVVDRRAPDDLVLAARLSRDRAPDELIRRSSTPAGSSGRGGSGRRSSAVEGFSHASERVDRRQQPKPVSRVQPVAQRSGVPEGGTADGGDKRPPTVDDERVAEAARAQSCATPRS